MKKILITGAESYIGESVRKWLERWPEKYEVDVLNVVGEEWKQYDFAGYDVVLHVAGIAHINIKKPTEDQRKMYYAVNRDLVKSVAVEAKRKNVKQFIFMSSMSVYSGTDYITSQTKTVPANIYGDSKLQAENMIRDMNSDDFRVVILRPPMVYGRGCKGNYQILAKLSRKVPVFPQIRNKRSVIYIYNLCEFIRQMINNREQGVFFPQDSEIVSTSELVKKIARANGHNVLITPLLNLFVTLGKCCPGKIGYMCDKAFGSNYYDLNMSCYKKRYRVAKIDKAIRQTERKFERKYSENV